MSAFATATAPPAGLDFAIIAGSGMEQVMNRPAAARDEQDRQVLADLLAQVAGGDRAALSSLYDRTSAKLYGICLRLLQREAEAQDVLQDVYLTVWQKARMFDASKASAITWLAVLARNRAIDRLRRRSLGTVDIGAAADVPDESPSALEIAERSQESKRLAECMDELDDRAREVIRAAFLDGATYTELATRRAVPLGTMKSWIRRGLLRLRGCLER